LVRGANQAVWGGRGFCRKGGVQKRVDAGTEGTKEGEAQGKSTTKKLAKERTPDRQVSRRGL